MAKWQTIEELKDIFIRKYTNSELGSELEKACSEEYELKRDYNGRQILELLQNVDDAYEKDVNNPQEEVSVKIVFKDNILEVGNTGTSFSQETIERLCLGRASDKSSENIGNKGTGFRSLLNDAEWIEVHSGNFSIRFSEQYAKNQFEEYIDKSSEKFNPLIGHQFKNWKKEYPLCFPIMNCPEQVKKCSSEFDTLIRVKVKEENRNKDSGILNQLKQPFYKSLLFLPNITKIVIEIDKERKQQYEKVAVDNKVLLSESQSTLNEYYVAEKEVSILGNKVANLIIAIPLDKRYDFSNEKLYCYFPIRDCRTPVNALIHAPFLTNNSRDDIPNDNEQINKKILEECLKFLKEISEAIVNDSNMATDLAIRTVTPLDNFTGKVWDSDCFNLKSFYLQLLTDAKLLPTVNGAFISLNDKPKCIYPNYPKQFKRDAFEELLIPLPDNVHKFIKQLALSQGLRLEYTEEELVEKINKISEKLSVAERIEIFLWWSDNYRNCKELPHLLKDVSGNWIELDLKIYLPTESTDSILPKSLSWVNLCVLSQLYVDELINKLKDSEKWNEAKSKLAADSVSNKRILDKVSDLYFPVDFIEQSNSDMIVDEINRQVDSSEKAIAFIGWFFKSYKDKIYDSANRYKLNFKLPDRDGELKSVQDLFFGKEYGKDLPEKIFKISTAQCAVAGLEVLFDGMDSEKEEIVYFLKRCGVCTYPKIYLYNFPYDYRFFNYIKEKYDYASNINYLSAMYIDGFKQVIESLNTNEVVQWITQDVDLYNLILSRERRGHFAFKKNASG